jgi:hypothetical protein
MADAALRDAERALAASPSDPESYARWVQAHLRAGGRDPRQDPQAGDEVQADALGPMLVLGVSEEHGMPWVDLIYPQGASRWTLTAWRFHARGLRGGRAGDVVRVAPDPERQPAEAYASALVRFDRCASACDVEQAKEIPDHDLVDRLTNYMLAANAEAGRLRPRVLERCAPGECICGGTQPDGTRRYLPHQRGVEGCMLLARGGTVLRVAPGGA